jgi:exodeoxyribonuclease VII small subunit
MKKQEPTLTYTVAYNELQAIVRDLQSDAVSIDDLPVKIARAMELVQFCREHLRQTEEKVKSLTDLNG